MTNTNNNQPTFTTPSDFRQMSDVKNTSVQRLFQMYGFVYDVTDDAPEKVSQRLSRKIQPLIGIIGDNFEFDITAIPDRDTVTREVTQSVLDELGEKKVSGEELEAEVICALNVTYGKYNAAIMLEKLLLTGKTTQGLRFGNKQFDTIHTLDHIAMATIIEHYHTVIRITLDVAENPSTDILAVYVDDPNDDNYGIYRTDNWVKEYAERYSTLTKKQAELLIAQLFSDAPRRRKETDQDLVVFNNCIFNYATKQTVPFDKKYIFDNKNAVNWRDNPEEPVIYNDENGTYWRPSEFIPALFTNDNTGEVDKERVLTVYQSIGATLRPRVSWDTFTTFFSTSNYSNNGKSATLVLIRTMLGGDCHTSIPIDEFDDPFSLESLIGKSAVLVDENDGDQFYHKTAKFISTVDGNIIRINRKYKTNIEYIPHVFMIQCFSETPHFKESANTLRRRAIYVPFTKSFTGRERKYIKDDYLRRPEVLEWFAWYVLTQLDDYYSINEPSIGKAIKNKL